MQMGSDGFNRILPFRPMFAISGFFYSAAGRRGRKPGNQFQEKKTLSEKPILRALGPFRGILGAALGVQTFLE